MRLRQQIILKKWDIQAPSHPKKANAFAEEMEAAREHNESKEFRKKTCIRHELPIRQFF